MAFQDNVFINCPFDADYKPLLKSLIFCLIYLEFEPRISNTSSSSNVRINEIKRLIRESKFGIHDLSRCKPLNSKDLPRFNMPYELGLDIGCFEFGSGRYTQKKILILETEKYFYQKVISDIAGQDIENHNDKPEQLIEKVRNWFSNFTTVLLPSPSSIWIAYNQFNSDLTLTLKANGFKPNEIKNIPIPDFIRYCKDWVLQWR